MDLVLYSDDINLLSYWEKTVEKKCSIVDSLDDLFGFESSLVIINYSAFLGQHQSILSRLNKQKNRVLVLDRTPTFDTAKEMLKLGAYGYGNALMREHFVTSAINTIKENMIWLYPEFTSQIIMNIPVKESVDVEKVLAPLSQRERETALFLKDGLSYKDVAQELDITPRTVKAHAQRIYAKLHLKDRLELALLLK